MTLSRLVARPLLASGFVYGAGNALRNADAARPPRPRRSPTRSCRWPRRPASRCPRTPRPWCGSTPASSSPAALALATGRAPRLAPLALAASLVPTTVAGHAFWDETDPAAKKAQHACSSSRTSSMLGGAAHRRRRHRGQARRRLARPPCRQGRPPRGQAPGRHRPPRGQARQGQGRPDRRLGRLRRVTDRRRPLARARAPREPVDVVVSLPGQQVADQPRAGAGRDRRRPVASCAGRCARATPC